MRPWSMTMRVRSGCAADNAAIKSASSSAADSTRSCGLRCGHSSCRMPGGLLAADDTQRRQRLVAAARQLQDGLLLEVRCIVETDVAIRSAQIDFPAVRCHVDRIKGVIERHPLLEPVTPDVDARERRIDAV